MISYVINNLAGGFLYDTYINFLHEVSPPIAASFWSFYGYATFISAALVLLIPKIGYKKLLIGCAVCTSTAFFSGVSLHTPLFLVLSTVLALTGVQLHFIMLAPFLSVYTESLHGKEIDWYTRTYYMGYIGYLLSTYFGGYAVVKTLSSKLHISYIQAREWTRYVDKMPTEIYDSYITSNETVLWVMGFLCLLSIVPILLIVQSSDDYRRENTRRPTSLWNTLKKHRLILFNRRAIVYLVYWAIVSFAMGLFTPYFTVFLNKVLHIDKVTSSLLVSLSYLAIVLFMFATPFFVKRYGEVTTIFLTLLCTCPFMILLGLGDRFREMTVPIVGVSLFFRAGLANLSSPADSSLSMALVPRSLRPAYTAVINILAGSMSVLSGECTGRFLFREIEGYRQAYFIAAVLYVIAGCVLYFGLEKSCKEEKGATGI